jgi:chemotaxis signal transduction protein
MDQDSKKQIANRITNPDTWMLPSEALGQHIPPVGMLFTDSTEKEIEIRYGYRIGQMGFLVGDGIISEVITNPVIHPLPRHSEYLQGVINQRGKIVPVFDLYGLFEDNARERDTQTVLVLGQGNNTAGLLIDDLPRTMQVTDEPCATLELPEVAADYVKPLFTINHRPWSELDFQGLLRHLANAHATNNGA